MGECLRCGEELDEYCTECQEQMLSEAIKKVHEERNKNAKRFRLVPIDEEGSDG